MNSDLKQTPLHGHFASVNGVQMYYEVHGQGDPLVLIHGYTDSTLSWQPYIGELAKYFRVIVPDLRGHGRTLDPTGQITLTQQALDVFALLDQLSVDRFKAIGDSGGGCSLLYMASWQPARLEAIILESCGSYFPDQTRDALLAWAHQEVLDSDPQTRFHLHGASQIRSLRKALPQLVEEYNTQPPDISKITAKTLIVFGDRDDFFPISGIIEMYASIADAYLWIVPNAGHGFIYSDPDKYAEPFTKTTLEFLLDEW
jgi:pimeloyl-ACP methyl ester carboxylesterase